MADERFVVTRGDTMPCASCSQEVPVYPYRGGIGREPQYRLLCDLCAGTFIANHTQPGSRGYGDVPNVTQAIAGVGNRIMLRLGLFADAPVLDLGDEWEWSEDEYGEEAAAEYKRLDELFEK